MSFGFMPGAVPEGCEVEAVGNSIVIGDTIVNTIYATDASVDWNHPNTGVALAYNLQRTLEKSGLLEHGAEILKR